MSNKFYHWIGAAIFGAVLSIVLISLPPLKPAVCWRCGITNGFKSSVDPSINCLTERPVKLSWVCTNCGRVTR